MLNYEPTVEQLDRMLRSRRRRLLRDMHLIVHAPAAPVALRRLRRDCPRHPALWFAGLSGVAASCCAVLSFVFLFSPLLGTEWMLLLAHAQGSAAPLAASIGVTTIALALLCAASTLWAASVGRECSPLPDELQLHLGLSRRLVDMDRACAITLATCGGGRGASPVRALHMGGQGARVGLL